jgi:hypothetical protein
MESTDPLLPGRDRPADDEECQCFNLEVVNVSPMVLMAFLVTLLIIVACVVLLYTRPEWKDSILPIMSTLGGLWVPSPAQRPNRNRR